VAKADRAHVFLTGAALSLQPVLGGMVGSRRHVGLTHLKPRTLFPDHPGRSARVLFAQSQAQCFIQAGSESADDGADLALCTSCVTCAAGLTRCGLFHVMDAAPHGCGDFSLRLHAINLTAGAGHLPQEEVLLMTHYLSAAAPTPVAGDSHGPLAMVLPGVRPGAVLLVMHAAIVVHGYLGATARTAFRVVRFAQSPDVPHLRLSLSAEWAARLERATFTTAASDHRDCADLSLKMLGGRVDDAFLDAARAAASVASSGSSALSRMHDAAEHAASARGCIYEELLRPCASLCRLHEADALVATNFGDVPLAWRFPTIAALRAALVRLWRQQAAVAPHDFCAGWRGDSLNGSRPARVVVTLDRMLCDDSRAAPSVLLAWLKACAAETEDPSAAAWQLYDATGAIDLVVESGAADLMHASNLRTLSWVAQSGELYMLARCVLVAEGPLGALGEPYTYLTCAPDACVRVTPRTRHSSSNALATAPASQCVLHTWAHGSVTTVRQLVVGDCPSAPGPVRAHLCLRTACPSHALTRCSTLR
jgi:hypothetical protein